MRFLLSLLLGAGLLATTLRADGPADNLPDKVRRIPPAPKEAISTADKAELQKQVDELGRQIAGLKETLKKSPALLELLPDVQIFHNAVRYALTYDEIFEAKKEVPWAKQQLKFGFERANWLAEGKAPWTIQSGPVVRGYISKIDNSVQPYGLVVPPSYVSNGTHRHRLDLWCHGRGETLSELNFLQGRLTSPGEFVPANALVLHLYGRYCNANKFAGEIDALEAMEHVKKHYRIDEQRIVMRGFSMGGAAAWQFAVHYPSLWCAAAPGAGFSETAQFLNVFQSEKVQPTDYEKKLWHIYDCTDYALNLFNLPTIAYSGEIDKQKQAADVMAKALAEEGMELTHLIGPKTGHSYHPETKKELNRRIDSIVAQGKSLVPYEVRFTTWTLRYNHCFWMTVEGLEKHWERGRVEGELGHCHVKLTTKGVTDLSLSLPSGLAPFDPTKPVTIVVDGQTLEGPKSPTDRSWNAKLSREGGSWKLVNDFGTALHKRPGLQGPIDDAFLDRFVMIKPTGKPLTEELGKWVEKESTHAIAHWRSQFRGEAIVKDDKAITEADIASSNLILWGDPSSNVVLAKLIGKLPIQWTEKGVQVGAQTYPSTHVPVLIFPNPLNPKKYVVLNSGFTYREYDYLNNARQVPKLPDWAVVDATTPMTSRAPGKIVAAGFFDEKWQLPTRNGK